MRLERPDLEEKRNQLIVRINADKSELKVTVITIELVVLVTTLAY